MRSGYKGICLRPRSSFAIGEETPTDPAEESAREWLHRIARALETGTVAQLAEELGVAYPATPPDRPDRSRVRSDLTPHPVRSDLTPFTTGAVMPTATMADRFLAAIRSSRQPRHVTEDHDYLVMMWRMVRALEARAVDNPEMLPQIVALAQRLAEVVNVSIATSAERYAIDPHAAASMAECARVLGITKQSASERKARGQEIIAARLAAAGAVRFAEAQRERDAIGRAAAHAEEALSEYRARHLRSVA